MANPFPGMDPFLEGDAWTTVHHELTSQIGRRLAPIVRPKYIVVSSKRVVVASPDPDSVPTRRLPDVGVLEAANGNGPVGVAVARAPLVIDALLPEEVPLITVEIRDALQKRLVTAIEVLSPTNKRGDGLAEYKAKRHQVMCRTAHSIEIDLLRIGERFPMVRPLPSVPYFVFLSRAGQRPRVETWPIALDAPLPRVIVPLLPGDPDVDLDLQRAFSEIYDLFGFDRLVDYTAAPPGPATLEQLAWIDERLRAASRR